MAKYSVNIGAGEKNVEVEADRIAFDDPGITLVRGKDIVAYFPHPIYVVKVED